MKFKKMHGLGNNFVVVDQKDLDAPLTPERRRLIADRRFGAGCDQLILIDRPQNPEAQIFMRIYNPDGSEAQACGNATRCVADRYMRERQTDRCVIETVAGLLRCRRPEPGSDLVQVDMGVPRLNWDQIPLAEPRDTLHLGLGEGEMGDPVAVNMGNPHAVFFVENVEKMDISRMGPQIEKHVLFPEGVNVEFAEVQTPSRIRMRVWERGTGITSACGTGACATMVAAVRRGLTGRKADIVLDGGTLHLDWREEDGHILMTGPVALVYEGEFLL